MKRISIRQIFALTLFALLATPLTAQFQQLYGYAGVNGQFGGIFKDVQCLDVMGPNNENIVTVGSDSQMPANGMLCYHNVAGTPLTYLQLNNPLGHLTDAKALCNTPLNKLVACYFDPVDRASDIVYANNDGTVNWVVRVPNFHVRDVVAASGQDNIYLTGNSTGQNPVVSVVHLTNAGALVYHKNYQLATPYSNTFGFEIDFNVMNQRLTVVGRSSILGCPDGMLILRIMPTTGAVLWSNVYSHPTCNFELSAKALVRTPGTLNHFTVAFERKDPTNPAFTFPGVMEIDGWGAVASCYFTTGFGFFNGNQYTVEGLDTDGTGFMISGSFRSSIGRITGYSLATALPSNSVVFTEYETIGNFNPTENRLMDLDFSAVRGGYVMGGHFIDAGPAANWPLSPTNVAFWLVDANATGGSTCSVSDNTTDHAFTPNVNAPTIVENTRFKIEDSPLTIAQVNPSVFNQCTPKRGSDAIGAIEDEVLNSEHATFASLEGKGQILANIPTSAKSEVSVKLIDLQGRVLSSYSLSAGEHHLNVNALSAGVYFLQYQGGGIQAGVQKIAIR